MNNITKISEKLRLRKVLNKILNITGRKRFCYVNWWKTWIFNLRCFDLKTACKLPVFIYNRVDVYWLGRVELQTDNVYKGMVQIGHWPTRARNHTIIHRGGTIIFHGAVTIQGGSILNGGGTLEFGNNVFIGCGCLIENNNHITFKDNVRFGFQCMIMDTDFHYMINPDTGKVYRNSGDVVIGEGSWVASNCRIMKGSRLPKDSVVGGGSLVNKDYTSESTAQIYVGTPAKPVKKGRRIHNVNKQAELDKYFREHPDEKSCVLETEDLDELCYSYFWGCNDRWSKQPIDSYNKVWRRSDKHPI